MSGLFGSMGIAPETIYGTYVAPTTRWVEASKVDLKKVKNIVQGGAMAAGRYMRPGTMRNVTTKAAGGTITSEAYSKRLGHFLQGIMGGGGAPTQQAATAAYMQTHTLGNTNSNRYTIQSGVPDDGDTVRPYTFLGSKFTAIEFKCGIDENLSMVVTVDSRDVTEAETLATPSYATGTHVFHFGQANLKLGTYGSTATIQGVRGFSLKIERKLRVDKFYMGNAGLKAEPRINDYAMISGSLDADYITKADLADRFAADSSTSLVWEFTGPNIAPTYDELIRFTVPQIFFDGDTPILDGPDIVTGAYPWSAAYDETHTPLTVEYQSTDTAL